MFGGADAFNGDISGWNVAGVTSMKGMFGGANAFNGDIGGWDVSAVTSFESMFSEALVFNQDISNWNVFRKSLICMLCLQTQECLIKT